MLQPFRFVLMLTAAIVLTFFALPFRTSASQCILDCRIEGIQCNSDCGGGGCECDCYECECENGCPDGQGEDCGPCDEY